jgi:cyanate permease
VAVVAMVGTVAMWVIGESPSAEQSSTCPSEWQNVRFVILQAGPWLIGACFALYGMQLYAVITWMPTFMIDERGFSPTLAGALTAVIVVDNGLGNVSDMERSTSRPIVRVAAMAVISNPFAGCYVDDLTELFEAGRALGEQFMTDLVHMLSQDPVSYGKGAIVGLNGEFEHGGACIHPMLGKPMRSAVGGERLLFPLTSKSARAALVSMYH